MPTGPPRLSDSIGSTLRSASVKWWFSRETAVLGKAPCCLFWPGLDRPTSGDLVVAEHDLAETSDRGLTLFRRKVIGMVFQSFNLLPTLNVLENVCLPALLAGRPYMEIVPKAREYLNWMGLDHRLTHLPAQLSGGEMQRTAIARALINDPAIILADEPTGNLDSRNGEAVMASSGRTEPQIEANRHRCHPQQALPIPMPLDRFTSRTAE